MAKSCKAVIFRGSNVPLAIEEVTAASPKENEVMVKINACGVCHTDFGVMNGSIALPPPIVLGHEASGVIAEVGTHVKDLAVGDHVVVSWAANCGVCKYCRVGKPVLCDEAEKAHITMRDGTMRFTDTAGHPVGSLIGVGVMAEYATLSRDNVVKIDKDISLEAASLLGCAVMTGVGAVINTAKVPPGSTVAVFGIGGVGINVIQGAALVGAEKIIAVSGSQSHIEAAKRFGATHIINTKTETNPVAAILELTKGGVDFAFECAGLPSTIAQSYEAIHKGGTAVVLGLTKMSDTVTLPSFTMVVSEKTLTGSAYGSARPDVDFPRLLALYQRGLLKLDEMVTHRYTIDEANQAFADLVAGKNIRGLIVF